MNKKPKHDELVRRIMSSPVAAQEFLEEYLPDNFKKLIKLETIKIEKESYVEASLRKLSSDLIYSVLTKDYDTALIHVSLEHQSTVDKWIAFRILRYNLLLWEKFRNLKKKLPIIYNLVMYNGKEPYTAPTSFWDLFENPSLAKEWMTGEYRLIDIQNMSDNEIIKKKHLGMLHYMLKVHTSKRYD